jgi:pimeloyl-ACP methyl ester carboxylesterase
MQDGITRHFATLGHRQVHYRRAGQGAPVLLLHPSPESSAAFIPLIARLAHRFTVIAPDTPGNGFSAPLDAEWPEMAAFADNVVALMDALAIPRAAIYGYHTGALCALELARRHPARLALCVANGYLHMPEAIRRDIAENYFVPLAPIDWSGSHLTWLWSRMREQWNFFPWYKKTLAYRGASDPPDALGLDRAVRNMLEAGDGYRGAYRAAFTFDAPQAVQQALAPTLITCPRDDILFPSLQAMPVPADCVWVEPADTLAACEDLLERALAKAAPDLPTPLTLPTAPIDGQVWSDTIQIEGLSLHACRSVTGAGRPLVFVHDVTGSSRSWDWLMAAFVGARPVIGIDLAGRGESDPWPDSVAPTIVAQAGMLAAALDAIGYRDIDLIADKDGAAIAVALAASRPGAVVHLILLEPPSRPARLAPSLVPDVAGGHLLTAWHAVRDRALFDPWHDRSHAAAITWREPDLDPARVHRRTLALLACAELLPALEASSRSDISDDIELASVPVLVGCPHSLATQRIADARPHIRVAELTPLDPARFAADALAFFDDNFPATPA